MVALDTPDLLAALPPALQRPTTTITRITAGMSGARVYRVSVGDRHFALKITSLDEPADAWRSKVQVQQLAASHGIAPAVVHVDEERRAVVSELIADQSLAAQLGNPASRDTAIKALGVTLRRLHALPIPAGTLRADPKAFLSTLRNAISADGILPSYVRHAIEALLAELPPPATGAVMSHNDVNPTNLAFDGTRVLLLDWQTAAPNSPYYDLATIAMFYRFDEDAARTLIVAHNDAPLDALPEAFAYFRRFVPVLACAAALQLARSRGHAGEDMSIEAAVSLGDLYQQMRAGTFDVSSVNGQWSFGLALVKEGVAPAASGVPRNRH